MPVSIQLLNRNDWKYFRRYNSAVKPVWDLMKTLSPIPLNFELTPPGATEPIRSRTYSWRFYSENPLAQSPYEHELTLVYAKGGTIREQGGNFLVLATFLRRYSANITQDEMGLVICGERFTDSKTKNGYYARIFSPNSTTTYAQLLKISNGTPTQLGSNINLSPHANKWLYLQIERNGNDLTLRAGYFDNNSQPQEIGNFTVSDTSFTSGEIFLKTINKSALLILYFDLFILYYRQ